MKTYLHAVSIYETQDVIQGISDFITGNVPGHNAAFAPSAPQVGSAVRRAMERRLEAARLSRLSLPPPADDWVDDPPEVKARNKTRLEALAASLASDMRTDDAEAARRLINLQQRTNARFDPQTMSNHLHLDPEDDEGDMGMSGAA